MTLEVNFVSKTYRTFFATLLQIPRGAGRGGGGHQILKRGAGGIYLWDKKKYIRA